MAVSTFGQRLKYIRTLRGYRQTDIAQIIGSERATVSAYELGKITPPYNKMKVIADFLYTTPEYLTGETDNPDKSSQSKPVEGNPPVELTSKIKGLMQEIQEPLSNITVNHKTASYTTVKTALKMLNCTLDVVRGLEQNGESPDKE